MELIILGISIYLIIGVSCLIISSFFVGLQGLPFEYESLGMILLWPFIVANAMGMIISVIRSNRK